MKPCKNCEKQYRQGYDDALRVAVLFLKYNEMAYEGTPIPEAYTGAIEELERLQEDKDTIVPYDPRPQTLRSVWGGAGQYTC